MRKHPIVLILLALGWLALTSCTEDTTAPSTGPTTGAPELAVASNTWNTRRDMWGIERKDFVTATVPNSAGQSVVYVIGGRGASYVGLTSVMAYNVATNTWTLRAPLPFPLYGMNGAGVINGKIYIAGGYNYGTPMPSLLVYDPAKNTWVRSGMPRPREDVIAGGYGVTGVINGKLYVLTECITTINQEYNSCSPDLLFRYNPATDRWVTLASPPENGSYTNIGGAGGVIGGKFYVLGYTQRYTGEGLLAMYDPATNQWTPKRGLGLPRWDAAAVVHAGKLYVIGGKKPNPGGETFETLRANIAFDPTTDRWTNYAPLPSARTGLAGSLVTLNGQPRIEVIGGSRPGNNVQYIP